ncbi:hypothetical protein KR215_007709 [Drosophila sulfurigaster]|nr:hypothetical protein KR215_007709 [Drosophila sulfurigaster]
MDLPFGHASPDLDVLIVGAGLSGLTSAVKILAKENSLNMKILDECSTPGGQLGTQGVRFVNAEQTDLLTFLNQMNVPLQERIENDRMQLKRCRDLDRGVLAMPIKFELSRYINMLDMRMKKFSSLRFPLQKRSMTMERHICSNLYFQRSRQFMFNLVELCSGLPANQIKYDEFMCLCSCCGGLGVMIDLVNGTKYTAQVVILALPWDRVMQLDFEPPLPKLYQRISASKPEPKTLLTQFHIRYSRSFWIYHGYSGDFSKIEPFIVGFAHPPAAYSGYILHTEGELISVRDTVLELLAEPFGEEMLSPLEFNQQTMLLSTAMIKPQPNPWLRIIWSGSASVATRNRNLMGGAVESGIRAAVNALYVVRPQVVSWRDLSDVQDKKLYEGVSFSRTSSLLSRINLYNFTFYSVFVIGLIVLLNFGYRQSAEIQV